MTVQQTIQSINQDKTQRKIKPTHAILTELLMTHSSKEIRDAVTDGGVGFGRTINSYYFYIKD